MEFAESTADIVVYGGSAGGGKSFALLYEPIGRQLHEVRGFYGVVFRRSYPEITNPGGLWDQAGEIYPYAGGRGVVGSREYRFRGGSRIAFRHLENEDSKHDYQGSAICYLAFDELTHFTASQFWYLLSRNRSTCGIRPYVRATCNPDPGWVKTLLSPWVDDYFRGTRAKSGEILWFIRVDGKIQWCDRTEPDAKSLTFIRASIYDNPILLKINPEYIATLKALPPVERARLLEGDWNVRREGLVYPQFQVCIVNLDTRTDSQEASVGGIDFGIRNPFAALWGHIDHDGVLWISGGRYKSECTIAVHSEALPRGVSWHCDPAGTEQWRQLREAGHEIRPCVHLPTRYASGERKNPKLAGIDIVTQRMRTGRLKIVRCEQTMPLIRELGMYHYDETKQLEEPVDEDNHACDALRYLVVGLDRGRSVQSIIEVESEQERAQREQAAAIQMRLTQRELDVAAQQDPFNPRWWGD